MSLRRSPGEPSVPESDLLLEKARYGDQQSLGQLLERSKRQLLNHAQNLIPRSLKTKLGASDLVQQTFQEAIRDFSQFQDGGVEQFRMWLTRLLENNARDATKRYTASQKRDVRRERRLLDQLSRLSTLTTSSSSNSPSANIENQEEARQLYDAVRRLNPAYQAIIHLAFVQELSCQEIMHHLNRAKPPGAPDKSEDAVRMLRQRALQQLKKELKRG